ncbi:general secretion pathway protein GspA, partial [Vibrio parahaemolyticus]|nr:general secretion pathway protein GspA [Vibrio parahaemolyticus]
GSAAIGLMAAFGVCWSSIYYIPKKPKAPMSEVNVASSSSTPAHLMATEQLNSSHRDILLEHKQSNLAVTDLYRLWVYLA